MSDRTIILSDESGRPLVWREHNGELRTFRLDSPAGIAAVARQHAELERLKHPPCIERPAGIPAVCPVTGLPFFMMIEHPDGELVPTYGGPYDSYTIPELVQDGEYRVYHRQRYDHDEGGWLVDEWESLGLFVLAEEQLGTLEEQRDEARAELERLRGIEASLRPAREQAMSVLDEAEAGREAAAVVAALNNSEYDISPCGECGEPTVCLPDGLTLCKKCADASSTEGGD